MKNRVIGIISAALLAVLTLGVSPASAASDWQLKASTPVSPISSSSFNIQYTILSLTASNFSVNLYKDSVAPSNLIGTRNTSVGPSSINGNSGAIPVNVADGQHNFLLIATRAGGEDIKTTNIEVNVNAQPPAAPTYLGKTRSGNAYTVRFTAPANSDVREVRIYSSTASTFTANALSEVGSVLVSPNQTSSFTYTASSNAERFHAVRAFDNAANGSTAVGDPNIVVTTTFVGGVGGVAANVGTVAGGAAAGQVAQAAGQAQAVPAGQTLGTNTNNGSGSKKDNKQGTVLGDKTTNDSGKQIAASFIVIVLALLGLIYWFVIRGGNNPFKRG